MTDLYQLTMANGYWNTRRHYTAVFLMFFRKNPFNGGYIVFSGLNPLLELLKNFSFTAEDIAYLSSLKGTDGTNLFTSDFLEYLSSFRLSCDILSIPEGTVVFPHEPVLRVQGNIIDCQILETIILNTINFSSLISTKAARIYHSAGGKEILEFGARRAQGADGALTATRAAYIGGCSATSNVLAGRTYNIPIKGTIAHSWIMSFENELEAFEKYVENYPNNCILLVDTYNCIQGIKNAIIAAKKLPNPVKDFIGIRIDSGDLAYLSIIARDMLDKAGFMNAKIIASSDLDEFIIHSLIEQGAKVDIWAVGTKLVTANISPAMEGIYKLSAIRNKKKKWEYKIKLSEERYKFNTPGILQTRRFFDNKIAVADAIYDTIMEPKDKKWKLSIP